MRDPTIFLRDILEAIARIIKFTEGMTFNEFADDDKTISAVVRKFEIIGEAAKNIPESITRSYPDIPWKDMAGMRDRLIHMYWGTDINLIWSTIKLSLPAVKSQIKSALNDINNTY